MHKPTGCDPAMTSPASHCSEKQLELSIWAPFPTHLWWYSGSGRTPHYCRFHELVMSLGDYAVDAVHRPLWG